MLVLFHHARRIFLSKYLYSTQASQSPLAQLRRRTGYSFTKCKEALTKFNNDVDQAEQYVREQAQKEGWAKAQRVKDRATSQGVIGVMIEGNNGVMIEVNCETDFVSKNSDFRKFAAEILESTFTNNIGSTTSHNQSLLRHMTSSDITKLCLGNNETVADSVAKQIGHFGENIAIPRACAISAGDQQVLSHFVYNDIQVPDTNVLLGTYASLALIGGGGVKDNDAIKDIGLKVCQHIVGMNPRPFGNQNGGNSGYVEERDKLVDQAFLLDPTRNMGEWLSSHDIHVTDFVRYELGEQ